MSSDKSAAENISQFLRDQENKDQLRFITCGSVDDGKSTLIGRLLYDSKTVFEDQLSAASVESQKYGTQGENVDLALLVDGLQAEREQGITIDVAYRYFETDKRKFIAADTPGHEQYTRNMATGASTTDLAIILIDARKGILEQTRRHSFICSLLGIKHVTLAVNKMDLMNFEQKVFDDIVADYHEFAKGLSLGDITAIPISALTGSNVIVKSDDMPWYEGTALLAHLETVDLSTLADRTKGPFRMPVQWVNRSSHDFRGFSGTIESGTISVGDDIANSVSGKSSKVAGIIGPSGDLDSAYSSLAVTISLQDEIDVSRGDVLAQPDKLPEVADQFAAHIVWMDEAEMLPERTYVARFATATATAQITDLVHRIDVNSLEQVAAKTLGLNEVGYCKIALDRALAFDSFGDIPETGSFILVDKFTNATIGAGMIDFALRRASNIEWHEMNVDKAARAKASGQKPSILWFTGFSGSGKSTVADKLEQKLFAQGKRTYLLDGDNVRHGINKDLGFTDQDRVENIRRVAEIARLMADAGLIVLTSFISPFRSERHLARSLMDDGEFIEVFVDTPLEVCEQRDPKGLYKKARAGDLKNFTGIDSDYEAPKNAEIVLKGAEFEVDELADQIIDYLNKKNKI